MDRLLLKTMLDGPVRRREHRATKPQCRLSTRRGQRVPPKRELAVAREFPDRDRSSAAPVTTVHRARNKDYIATESAEDAESGAASA